MDTNLDTELAVPMPPCRIRTRFAKKISQRGGKAIGGKAAKAKAKPRVSPPRPTPRLARRRHEARGPAGGLDTDQIPFALGGEARLLGVGTQVVQRELAAGERDREPAAGGRAAEVEVPERRGWPPVGGKAKL
jgi:hypothetical protein